jgi:stage III sporulation protein AH
VDSAGRAAGGAVAGGTGCTAAADGGLDLTADSSGKNAGDALLVDNQSTAPITDDSYFAQAKTDRDKAQADSLKILQEVVNDAKSSAAAKEKASADIAKIAKNVESQSAIENLVKAKGFTECVTIITGDQVNIVVKSPGLLENEVIMIQDIATGQTGLGLDNIKIVERK